MADFFVDKPCRILSLDGGGAKGFYTLGVLREIEGLIGCPLHERFDLIFGTSTGAFIAALLGLGKTVKEISVLYEEHVPHGHVEKEPAREITGSRNSWLTRSSKMTNSTK